jgi:hypothetical protein
MVTAFWQEKLKERDHSEDLCVNVKIILEWMLDKYGEKLWAGYMWLRIETSDGHL